MKKMYATIDGIQVPIEGEKNLLEVIRKANIELPTFCYHSEISVYGACRMCMVDIEGRGLQPSCSTAATDGMVVKTNTREIRNLRKMIVELMLAHHDQNCATCPKSGECRLQEIAHQLGVGKVRFKQLADFAPLDVSSDAIVRDPSKCVLCGDCVRVCSEIQSVGVLDFAQRGSSSQVVACFNKPFGTVECVNCGQCIKVCPVGALTPKFQINEVWNALHHPKKTVVVQIAPAVRVALGEYFGYKPGTATTGQIITALRMMGFDQVYDTSFAADLTVLQEGDEFLDRYGKGVNLPQFTSCCPAWVKFAEQYYPDMLPNLSTCKSPQQMFGSVCKDQLTKMLNISREDLVVVSIMPCTAKKFEAKRPEFLENNNPDVDFVLTTKELSLMIKEQGIDFEKLEPGSFDLPFGFKTGAGVIFGNSGGVSEAVLRYAAAKLNHGKMLDVKELRSGESTRIAEIKIGEVTLRLAVVSGLANARKLIDKIRSGEEHFDLVEVMACCGGCINGGGQPTSSDHQHVGKRAKGLQDQDKMLQFHSAQENPYLQELMREDLTAEKAHHLLHTLYQNRKRISLDDIMIRKPSAETKISMKICLGTSCFLRGAQNLYTQLNDYIHVQGLDDVTEVSASFCNERCQRGPVVIINGSVLEHCTFERAVSELKRIQMQMK